MQMAELFYILLIVKAHVFLKNFILAHHRNKILRENIRP